MKILIVLFLVIAVDIKKSKQSTEANIDVSSGDHDVEELLYDAETIIDKNDSTDTIEVTLVEERTAKDDSDFSESLSPNKEDNERSAEISAESDKSDDKDDSTTETEQKIKESSEERNANSEEHHHHHRKAKKVSDTNVSDLIKQLNDTVDGTIQVFKIDDDRNSNDDVDEETKIAIWTGNGYNASIINEEEHKSNITRSVDSESDESDSEETSEKGEPSVLRSFFSGRKALRANQRELLKDLLKPLSARSWNEEPVETGSKRNYGSEVRTPYQGQLGYSDPYGYNLNNYQKSFYDRFTNDLYKVYKNSPEPEDNKGYEDHYSLFENAYPYHGGSAERHDEAYTTDTGDHHYGTYDHNLNSFYQLYGHRY